MTAVFHRAALGVLVIAALALAGCNSVPAGVLRLTPDTDRNRELQTRHFDDVKESDLLAAGAGVVQDLGFTLDESESRLGLISASRRLVSHRPLNATEALSGVALTAMIPWLGGPSLAYNAVAGIKEPQAVRISLVTTPDRHGTKQGSLLRVTAQRIVYMDEKFALVKLVEPMNDPKFYEEFFTRLRQSTFLEKGKNAL